MKYTDNLHLPLFEKGDNPALLGDLNSAMEILDANTGGGGGASFELIGSTAELRSTNPDGLTIDTSKMDSTKNQIVLVFYKRNNYNDGIYNPIMLSSYLNDTNTVMWQESGSPNIQINKSAGKLYNYMGDSYVMYDVKVYLMTEGASGGSAGSAFPAIDFDNYYIDLEATQTKNEEFDDYLYFDSVPYPFFFVITLQASHQQNVTPQAGAAGLIIFVQTDDNNTDRLTANHYLNTYNDDTTLFYALSSMQTDVMKFSGGTKVSITSYVSNNTLIPNVNVYQYVIKPKN